MIQAKCIQKFRDPQNRIYEYKLVYINGIVQSVDPENLKRAILNKYIDVTNLTLTKDGRLIDKGEEGLKSSKLGSEPQSPQYKEDSFWHTIGLFEHEFCKYIGKGVSSCYPDMDKSNGVFYTDKILGVYYPDEYKGDAGADPCYGVTFSLEFNNDKKEAVMLWQGNNGMAKEEFSSSVTLTSPLYTVKNAYAIRDTFFAFAKRVKQWIHNDKIRVK